ncbi:MAG TPA: YafY family protein [Roseiflexaceae bacterium]|nr:YafY family protein [Roseiflexaceae bacterium]
MNRTDRLLAIVLELQARGKQRAEDLAATFEVGKRTIYRDIQALCGAGVPVVSTPGQGYTLLEGYFLPPLRFTPDEALILLLGGDVMADSFDAEYRAAAQSAGRKIAGALPEPLREEVRALQDSVRYVGDGGRERPHEIALLRQLRRAILGRHGVRFSYHARHGQDEAGAYTTREADPYGLVFYLGAWHMTGFCHLRQDIRHFRVERMQQLAVLPRTFTRPPDFKLQQRDGEDERRLVVCALFDRSIADWVRESPSYFAVGEEQRDDGLLITLRVRHEREVLQWLLGWGARVRVLEPESLRALLADEAAKILRNHASG